jgi:hypothetical protein
VELDNTFTTAEGSSRVNKQYIEQVLMLKV